MLTKRLTGPLATLLALSAAPAALAQETPRIFAGKNGEIEATYSNNCVVYYNADGSRREANGRCNRGQVISADKGVASYRREQGMDGYPGSEAPPGGFGGSSDYDDVPEVHMDSHGRSHVNVGNHCTVYYDRQGRLNDQSATCSASDRRQAADAIAAYRREQGIGTSSSHGSHLGVSVVHLRNGNYQATMTGGCTVWFRENGRLLTALPKCDANQKARAGLAVIAFRRDHPGE